MCVPAANRVEETLYMDEGDINMKVKICRTIRTVQRPAGSAQNLL